MFRRLAVIFSAGLVLLVGFATTAHAETQTLVDAQGDMWKDDGGDRTVPAPRQKRADIRRATVTHTERAVLVRTRFTELQRTGAFLYLAVRIRTNTGLVRYAFLVADRAAEAGWRGDTDLIRRNGRPVECATTHRLDYATNVARVRVPRSCLGAPRWVQATVVSAWVSGGRTFTFFYDNAHNEGLRRPGWTRRLRHG